MTRLKQYGLKGESHLPLEVGVGILPWPQSRQSRRGGRDIRFAGATVHVFQNRVTGG